MAKNNLLTNPAYDVDRLLDFVINMLHLKNDLALAKRLDVGHPAVSKLRHRRLSIGSSMLIRIHEETGLSVTEIRRLYGVPKELKQPKGPRL